MRLCDLSDRELHRITEDFVFFCDSFGVPLFDWQREAFGGATQRVEGRFVCPLGGISVPRGDGKSWGAACVGAWRFLFGPQPHDVLSVALDFDGAKVVLDHARRLLRAHPDLEAGVDFRADDILNPSTGGSWRVKSREHTASRGLHPDTILYDETGWARDDELFGSLLAAQASVRDPLFLVVSTVGRRKSGPLWRIKELAEGIAA
jgi:phage terminase large subunit-like protein